MIVRGMEEGSMLSHLQTSPPTVKEWKAGAVFKVSPSSVYPLLQFRRGGAFAVEGA